MRQITRTALVVVLATTLTATSALAAPAPSKPSLRRERATITEIAQRLMKRIFGNVTANSDIIWPRPDSSTAPDDGGR